MKKRFNSKLITVTLALLLLLTTLLPMSTAFAEGTPPTTIGAPLNFGAANHMGSSVVCTLSAPDDLRALIDQTDKERGYGIKIMGQVDFKVDNGSWHYTADWDNKSTYFKYTLNYYNSLTGGTFGRYLGQQSLSFKEMFPTDTNVPVPAAFTSWEWYKSHKIVLKARFVLDFGGGRPLVFSDWSSEYLFTDSSKMDYKKILAANPPVLKSTSIETNTQTKRPYLVLQLDRHPVDIQKFNAATGCRVSTDIWLRKKGDKDFKKVGAAFITDEKLRLDIGEYLGKSLESYDAAAYEVKAQYSVDERAYEQSDVTSFNMLYSTFSNVLSYNMPAWSASKWATAELQTASDQGLITDSLKSQDLTKNITREEFAEVALLMYQKASGITNTEPVSPNPFTDTTNPQILKAFKLGIVKGVKPTEFAPKDLINREQVAAMLTRAIKLIAPKADYSATGAPSFTDQKDIDGWALNDSLYIAKIGIIKGTDGKFMPRAVTDAQKALGYANTSREQALVMSVRAVDKVKELK